jgi:hypothetical protein
VNAPSIWTGLAGEDFANEERSRCGQQWNELLIFITLGKFLAKGSGTESLKASNNERLRGLLLACFAGRKSVSSRQRNDALQ